MGLFDKKFCDICGDKIGLLGNRKLEDGNMCKDCAKKLSPFFSERRHSSISDIKLQLAYREKNREQLRFFNPDRVFGDREKVFVDSAKGAFVVSRYSQNDWDEENPDIISIAAVNSCNLRIDRDEEEEYYENSDGERVSFNPPRYRYYSTLVLELNVNSPYFDDIEITLNNIRIEDGNPEYMTVQQTAVNIMSCIAPGKFTMPGGAPVYQQTVSYNQPQGYAQPVMNPYSQPQGYAQPVMNPYSQPQVNPYGQQPTYQQPVQGFPNNAGANWFCSACGTPNTGNFCQSCGTRKA